jgi:hypothetical protein
MPKIVWLLEETLTAIHHRQIDEHGGSEGLRDEAYFCLPWRDHGTPSHMVNLLLTLRLWLQLMLTELAHISHTQWG